MKLYERLGDQGFHTSVISTFGVDFDAFENIALARLRGAGCNNNLLVVDHRMLTHALDGASIKPLSAGRLYRVAGAGASGVFHPKVIVQLGRKRGRAIISSANATSAGLAGNLEVAGIVECDHDQSGDQQLVAAAWAYLARCVRRDTTSLSDHFGWAEARTPWLARANSTRTRCAFRWDRRRISGQRRKCRHFIAIRRSLWKYPDFAPYRG